MSSKSVTTKLYIGNLPDLCRVEELQAKFEKYGNVSEFDIVSNYGFAHYQKADEARAAADALNGTEYNGNTLKVELSHSRVRQKPGMGEKDGCFRCGQEGHWSKDCPTGPRRPRMPPPGGFRDPYDEEPPFFRDPYADPYYRARYLPPPPPGPPGYARYDPYYDPYDRRPLPLPSRDPYLRDRLADPYARPHPDYYARRSPPMGAESAASRDPYDKDPYGPRAPESAYGPRAPEPHYGRAPESYAKDPYAKDPYAKDPYNKDPYAKDAYGPQRGDPYEEMFERRRAFAANVRSAPYSKPSMGNNSLSAPTYSSPMQSSRVPGPY